MSWQLKAFIFVGGLVAAGCSYASLGRAETTSDEDATWLRQASSESYVEAKKAAQSWPNCAAANGRSGFDCASWTEDNVSFRLVGIRRREIATPVIESRSGRPRPDRIVIYLNGGPDMWPFAYLPDARVALFRTFYEKRYKVASIAYWGTSFRTNLEEGEIKAASQDLQAVYVHYARRCGCRPMIVAESLGASVLFYTMRKNPKSAYMFVALSPAMQGMQQSVTMFEEAFSPKAKVINSRASHVYERSPGTAFRYRGSKLINSLQHMKSFVGQEDNSFAEEFLTDRCSRVIIGAADHHNQLYRPPMNKQILVLPNLGHDLDLAAGAGLTTSLLAEAIACHTQAPRP